MLAENSPHSQVGWGGFCVSVVPGGGQSGGVHQASARPLSAQPLVEVKPWSWGLHEFCKGAKFGLANSCLSAFIAFLPPICLH